VDFSTESNVIFLHTLSHTDLLLSYSDLSSWSSFFFCSVQTQNFIPLQQFVTEWKLTAVLNLNMEPCNVTLPELRMQRQECARRWISYSKLCTPTPKTTLHLTPHCRRQAHWAAPIDRMLNWQRNTYIGYKTQIGVNVQKILKWCIWNRLV
jgi:hypothetical protein